MAATEPRSVPLAVYLNGIQPDLIRLQNLLATSPNLLRITAPPVQVESEGVAPRAANALYQVRTLLMSLRAETELLLIEIDRLNGEGC
jgi:hypothetical protein